MAQLLGDRQRHLVDRDRAMTPLDRRELFDINDHYRLAVGWLAGSLPVSADWGCPPVHRSKVLPKHQKVLVRNKV
jgi:hypothetical protein